MTVEDPKNKSGKITPGVGNVPTIDELPPPGYRESLEKGRETIKKDFGLTDEDISHYEEMASNDN
jgi:hypothetical protein